MISGLFIFITLGCILASRTSTSKTNQASWVECRSRLRLPERSRATDMGIAWHGTKITMLSPGLWCREPHSRYAAPASTSRCRRKAAALGAFPPVADPGTGRRGVRTYSTSPCALSKVVLAFGHYRTAPHPWTVQEISPGAGHTMACAALCSADYQRKQGT